MAAPHDKRGRTAAARRPEALMCVWFQISPEYINTGFPSVEFGMTSKSFLANGPSAKPTLMMEFREESDSASQ